MSESPRKPRRRLPSSYYNAISMLGAGLAALSLCLILFMMALEHYSGGHGSPYMGVLAFVVLPGFLILGLAVAAFGALRQQRRRRLGLPTTERLPKIDFNDPTHLRGTIMVGGGFLVFLALTAFGSYKAYEFTESDQFCGTMCHTVMKPEYTAFNESPHARVGCVKCHIGPGAEWFVKSKLSGAYQVYSVAFNKYPRPIETPIRNLRPSRDTCEQCHWPEHFTGDRKKSYDYYAADEENTHWSLDMLLKVGGGGARGTEAHGIHWHMANTITYVATDDRRQEIPWVKFVGEDGSEKIYRSTESDLTDEEAATHEQRLMDCIDCHNRPTHHYNPPRKMVNWDMADGLISPELPGIKHVLVELMEAEYETEQEALDAIDAGVRAYYTEEHPDVMTTMAAQVEQAVERAQYRFRTNIFPEMRVNWREFPDNIGHLDTPGCFRCHDGLHETDTGEVLSRDCTLCHVIIEQKTRDGDDMINLAGVEYVHPEDIGDEWKVTNCSECHGE